MAGRPAQAQEHPVHWLLPSSTRSSVRVSVPASPRNGTFLRGLDGESGTAVAEEVRTGWASPSLRTHGTEFPCLWTLRLSASDFQPKVKPKCMYDCASAKSSSICQLRPGGPTQGSPHQTLQWHCGFQCVGAPNDSSLSLCLTSVFPLECPFCRLRDPTSGD